MRFAIMGLAVSRECVQDALREALGSGKVHLENSPLSCASATLGRACADAIRQLRTLREPSRRAWSARRRAAQSAAHKTSKFSDAKTNHVSGWWLAAPRPGSATQWLETLLREAEPIRYACEGPSQKLSIRPSQCPQVPPRRGSAVSRASVPMPSELQLALRKTQWVALRKTERFRDSAPRRAKYRASRCAYA